MSFSKQAEILNDRQLWLAAIAQTAIHGWHGADSSNDDCTARTIANIIGADPVYTFNWYQTNTYDMPEAVIEKIKDITNEQILDLIENVHVTELAYPPKGLIEEFKK